MKMILGMIFILFSFSIFALEESKFTERLEEHQNSGHLTSDEIDDQKFEIINSKKYHRNFNKTVRGVASQLKEPKNKVKFTNPDIEIPVN